MEIKKATLEDGVYTADVGISIAMWQGILRDKHVMKEVFTQVLHQFIAEPEHAATCQLIAEKYKKSSQQVDQVITNFGKAVADKLNSFRVIGTNNQPAYWLIPMFGKKYNDGFKWVVRPELIQAIRSIESGEADKIVSPVSEQIVDKISVLEKQMVPVESNSSLLKSRAIKRIFVAKNGLMSPPPLGADELSMDEMRQQMKMELLAEISSEVGVEVRNEMREGIEALKKLVGNIEQERDKPVPVKEENQVHRVVADLEEKAEPVISEPVSPTSIEMLTIEQIVPEKKQSVVSREERIPVANLPVTVLSNDISNFLQELYDQALEDVDTILYQWFPIYKKQVKTYKQEVLSEHISWTREAIFNLINGVAINKTGDKPLALLNDVEQTRIVANWDVIKDIVEEAIENLSISNEKYKILQTFFARQVGSRISNIANRVVAAVLPGLVTTMVDYNDFKSVVIAMKNRFPDYPNLTNDWFLDNRNFINYCNGCVLFKEPWHASLFIFYIKESFEKESLCKKENQSTLLRKECTQMLLLHRNLIIQGVTGSGKTRLAKNIAEALNAEVAFVPASSIGDFWEIDDKRHFVPNGDFDELPKLSSSSFVSFCRRAALNLYESEKPAKPFLFQKAAYTKNIKSLIEKFKNRKDSGFSEDRNQYGRAEIEAVPAMRKNFVYILDGVSGFNALDVFQETLYSIAAHLRGKKGRVRNQYNNASEIKEDPFHDGFYIPENVYIIMTVDSLKVLNHPLDFDSSKDFIWKNISVEDGLDLMNDVIGSYKLEAVKRLKLINDVIDGCRELGKEYRIGAAYFLKIKKFDGDFDALWDSYLKGVLKRHIGLVPGRDSILGKIEAIYKSANQNLETKNGHLNRVFISGESINRGL